jgi:hypothetical protein
LFTEFQEFREFYGQFEAVVTFYYLLKKGFYAFLGDGRVEGFYYVLDFLKADVLLGVRTGSLELLF